MEYDEQVVVQFVCELADTSPDESEMERIVTTVCREIALREDLSESEVSITIVDNTTIQELNRDYRGLDQVTDVLSFAMLEGDDEPIIEAEEGVQTLGDIVISFPRLCEQASEYGHSIQRELAFLTAHGFYHLLGYDHQTKETEQAMFGLQESVLTALGFLR
ncbi:MAG: rRNA maturation RNase YbeY [Acidibacillus sp.]|uniref:Endoribonuclease YbeY n=1 Tax=Sulfoacidibacillus ferrooxidans TaxID=2005001 RepID=A0A9X1V9A3_9BACL|nr:Endoribonuclease YbeY [Sulfoacidibacillus ferrooxidans]MCY0892836.1 rRNA maturation RNase YbeY [Acidibacillus sp.]